jgi:predicted nucleic acid-binding Zn ribbon protein
LKLVVVIEEDSSRAAIPSSPYNYKCKECDKVFPNVKELTHHYRMDHPEGL